MTRNARTPAGSADQAEAATDTSADPARQPGAAPAASDLKAMLQQAVLQLADKREVLLKGRAELVDHRLRLLSKPVGIDEIKRLACAPIDERARDFTNRAGWTQLLTDHAYPKGNRPALDSYQGGAEFERTTTAGSRMPLCVGDMLALRASGADATHAHGLKGFLGLRRSDFVAGNQDAAADTGQDRYPVGGNPTITSRSPAFDSEKHLLGLICFLAGDILKQRIADFIERNLARTEAGPAVNWREIERQLADLTDRIAAFDCELTQVDTELADLPVSCAECNGARYRLGRPMLDQAASLAAAGSHS